MTTFVSGSRAVISQIAAIPLPGMWMSRRQMSGPLGDRQLDHARRVRCLAHDLEALVALENLPHLATGRRVVVRDDYPRPPVHGKTTSRSGHPPPLLEYRCLGQVAPVPADLARRADQEREIEEDAKRVARVHPPGVELRVEEVIQVREGAEERARGEPCVELVVRLAKAAREPNDAAPKSARRCGSQT
jgi:hypothetical protein